MTMITELRAHLAEVLKAAGPDRPTLCEGWRTRDLLAHLLLRETRPDVAAGVALPPLAARTERLTRQLGDQLASPDEYADGLRRFTGARTPTRAIGRVDAGMNTIEYLVHREDVVRGQEEGRAELAALTPFRPDEQELIWGKLGGVGLISALRHPGGLRLVGTDADGEPVFGERVLRRPARESLPGRAVQAVVRAPEEEPVTVTGQPLELLLHLFGREADVELS
ncbi:maleylpyruvate isomerase family mycothiol-dependent enzyme [Rothia kristinae]|uniref:Maleylpyruvate isomerase family mycothiol-dependent enzyme n=1 Tax=Rothia kristinae TaxID=37923 RepID=A0A7T3CFP7_9MICC|nr:maleylpyruvate isomerase family mycothiol-dependent enzyme [Rothia kristinae]QPT53310.1 maleylpyruvate isomerase family mycothiol-dependent enzyme [Rothia kristinae]